MFITEDGKSVDKLLFSIDISFIIDKFKDELMITIEDASNRDIMYKPELNEFISYGLFMMITDLTLYNKLYIETLHAVDYAKEIFADISEEHLDLPVVKRLFYATNSLFKEIGLYLEHTLMSLNVPISSFFSVQSFNGSTVFLIAETREVEFYDKV